MDGAAHPLFYINRLRPDQAEDVARNIEASAFSGLPELKIAKPHDGVAVVVGGAPSAKKYLAEIKRHRERGHRIYAVNDMHDWLIENGVVPDGMVFHEVMAMPIQVFAKPHPDVTYYVASWCDPLVRHELKGYKVLLWHGAVDKFETRHEEAMRCFPQSFRIGGGYATLHRTLNIASVEGFSNFDVYGFECSHDKNGDTHATGRGYPERYPEIDVIATATKPDGTVIEKKFTSRAPLMRQADEFNRHCRIHPSKMRVHGDGLVPWMHRTMFPAQYEVTNG